MNQTAAKGFRRDLRRALGPEAVTVLNSQGEAIAGIQQHITDRLDPHRDWLQTELVRQGQQFDAFAGMGWRARLKWVLGL